MLSLVNSTPDVVSTAKLAVVLLGEVASDVLGVVVIDSVVVSSLLKILAAVLNSVAKSMWVVVGLLVWVV